MNTVRGVEEHVRMALRILNSLLWESLFHEWVWQLIFWNVAFSDYQSSYISGWGPAHTLLKNAENKSCIIFIMIFHFLTFIWNKAIVVLRVAAFFDQNINLLTFQLLTYFMKKMRKCLIFKLKKHLRKFKYWTYQHLLITGWKSQKMQIRHFIWWNGSLLKIFFVKIANL